MLDDPKSLGYYTSSLFADFSGQTLIDVYSADPLALNALHEHLLEQIDEDADGIHQDLVRLGAVLLRRSLADGKVTSIVTRLIQQPPIRDPILKIGRLCPSFTVLDAIVD